jgi:hypothetical protein
MTGFEKRERKREREGEREGERERGGGEGGREHISRLKIREEIIYISVLVSKFGRKILKFPFPFSKLGTGKS